MMMNLPIVTIGRNHGDDSGFRASLERARQAWEACGVKRRTKRIGTSAIMRGIAAGAGMPEFLRVQEIALGIAREARLRRKTNREPLLSEMYLPYLTFHEVSRR